MFKNVLVGVDGTQTGRDAIALAARLVEQDGKLTLGHVHSDALGPLHAMAPGFIPAEREISDELLERERAAAGVSADLLSIAATSPGAGLHRQAEKQGADLLVVGSTNRGPFGRVMLGDDTHAALNGAPCAVAIAARGYAEHSGPFTRVGVGYHDSPESKRALEIAREVAAPTNAELHALEVVPITTYTYTGVGPTVMGTDVQEILTDATARLSQLQGVSGHAVLGLAGEELAAFGADLDLLVVGSRGYGPMRRLVLGSTSSYLERHARCSLLVLQRIAASS